MTRWMKAYMKLTGLRKFILTLLVFLVSLGLLLWQKITADHFVSLNQVIIPAFIGANLIERYLSRDSTDTGND